MEHFALSDDSLVSLRPFLSFRVGAVETRLTKRAGYIVEGTHLTNALLSAFYDACTCLFIHRMGSMGGGRMVWSAIVIWQMAWRRHVGQYSVPYHDSLVIHTHLSPTTEATLDGGETGRWAGIEGEQLRRICRTAVIVDVVVSGVQSQYATIAYLPAYMKEGHFDHQTTDRVYKKRQLP